MMKPCLMNTTEFGEIFEFLDQFPRKIENDVRTLIQLSDIPKYKIKDREIKRQREIKRGYVVDELQRLVQIKETYKGTYQRLKFLNKFFLYSGIQKFKD